MPLRLLQAGVSKLNEAKALVDELSRRAGGQSALLKTKQDEADAALQEITASMQVGRCRGRVSAAARGATCLLTGLEEVFPVCAESHRPC